jgi:hypothetical protein
MASAAFLQMTRKRPWVSLGAAATGITTASAFGLEAYADRQEQRVVSHHSGKTTAQVEEALAAAVDIGLPRTYDRRQIRSYWLQRPVSVAKRVGEIFMELGRVGAQYYLEEKMIWPGVIVTGGGSSSEESSIMDHGRLEEQQRGRLRHHAEQLREALTNLGPAWVKGASCSFVHAGTTNSKLLAIAI